MTHNILNTSDWAKQAPSPKPKPHISQQAWQVIRDILATSPCGTDASIGELHEDATKRRVLAVLEHKLEVR